MDLQNSKTEVITTTEEKIWTEQDEKMLEKSIKELEKGRITEHEKVLKKIKKQY